MRVVRAGSYPDGISQRILFDATANILVAAAAHGTFNLHRIVLVHDMKPFSQAAYYLLPIIKRWRGERGDIIHREPLSRPHSR